MTVAGTLATDQPDRGRSLPPAALRRIEVVPAAAAEAFVADWRSLWDHALDDAPFQAPEFLLPAAIHAADGGPELVAVWDEVDGETSLAGLFPLAGLGSSADVWTRPHQAAFWRHPLQPFALPLIAGPTDRAARTVGALLDWLGGRSALAGLDAAALPAGSAASELLVEAARARGLPLLRQRETGRTRGLHFKPLALKGAVDRVTVATSVEALPAALEQLLCLDREEAASQAIVLRDPLLPALLRAAVRGFGGRGRAAIALADADDARAGALVLLGRDRGYLWRLFGPGGDDPANEAALAVAVERHIGLPIASASIQPLSGAGSEAMPTESVFIGLRPEPASVFGRLRVWLASGLFGLS